MKLVMNFIIFKIVHILSNIEISISKRDIQKDQTSLTSLGMMALTYILNQTNLCKFIRVINERVCPG